MAEPCRDRPSKGLILVTGASSFVGTHVIATFLAAGYHVRGQVRTAASAAKVRAVFAHHSSSSSSASSFTTVVVPDITRPGAFDAAVAAVDGVIHTASPFVFAVRDNEKDLLDPAVKGTTRLLEAVVARQPQPHPRRTSTRVVITSSFAAILDPAAGPRPGYTYTEADWNPVTYAAAAAADTSAEVAYCASKTFAERAAVAFAAAHAQAVSVATVCPPLVYGPVAHDADLGRLNTSIADIYRLMNGSQTEPGATAFPAFADVRDVAAAHLRAYERDSPGRYLVSSGSFEYIDVCRVLRDVLPGREDRIPDPALTPRADFYRVDASKTRRELGIEFRSLDETIRDTALSLVALEQGSKSSTCKEECGASG